MGSDRGTENEPVTTSKNRIFSGVDRGFLYGPEYAMPWIGITSLTQIEDGYRSEKYYQDGRLVGRGYVSGEFSATVDSYTNPFELRPYVDVIFGFSYRESYLLDGVERYRLHIIHGVSIFGYTCKYTTTDTSISPDIHTYSMVARDVALDELLDGSHLILDSNEVFPWVLRDIENVLYGTHSTPGRIPSLDEIYDIFATMNFVIIDHGDGTWSAVGHESMISMLDATEFAITSESVEMVPDELYTYDVESLIRDERWLE